MKKERRIEVLRALDEGMKQSDGLTLKVIDRFLGDCIADELVEVPGALNAVEQVAMLQHGRCYA